MTYEIICLESGSVTTTTDFQTAVTNTITLLGMGFSGTLTRIDYTGVKTLILTFPEPTSQTPPK